MGEELDPSLEPVLAKAFVKRGNATLIKLGDKEIDFNPDFRLYITTKLGAHCALLQSACMPCHIFNLGLTNARWHLSLQVSSLHTETQSSSCRHEYHPVMDLSSHEPHQNCCHVHDIITRRREMHTQLACCAGNPHYTPEVSTKVMIVNFAVKQQGLEAQLLNTVVKQERADLDRQKNELVVKVAQGKRTQVGCHLYPRLRTAKLYLWHHPTAAKLSLCTMLP